MSAQTSLTGQSILKIDKAALTLLAQQAFVDCAHLLRPAHLAAAAPHPRRPRGLDNDRFVALDLLKNANIAAGMVLPMCQDTGTAIVMGKKGQRVWTGGGDAAALSPGRRRTYTETNLRYSQVAPLSMFEEINTGNNLPAQIDLYADEGDEYHFLFIAKGGGSANKTFLYQQTKARAQSRSPDEIPRREDPHARHRRLPALSPCHRHRRHLGRDDPQDREAGLDALSRHLPTTGSKARPGLPRPATARQKSWS